MSTTSSRIATVLLALSFVSLTGCWEKNIETREKISRGREKVTLAEDMAETGDYDYHRDNVWRAGYLDRLEHARKDRKRDQMIQSQLRDGTLMDKY
ncbi:MAG: hypothetical protein U0136_06780 [Bdellovibrionota bacterium]